MPSYFFFFANGFFEWSNHTTFAERMCYLFFTVQKMKSSIEDFFSKCDQIQGKLPIWSHLMKKSSMENSIFCASFAY